MSDAIPSKRSAAKNASKRRAGEKKDHDYSPPIRFHKPKPAIDESESDDEVNLSVEHKCCQTRHSD